MRIADVDFILIPDWQARSSDCEPDSDHWISRWERNLATAKWLSDDPSEPAAEMGAALLRQADGITRPIVIVTHGRGFEALLDVHVALGARTVIGAFIVAPSPPPEALANASTEHLKLAFPSVIVGTDDHPEFAAPEAQRLADQMGGAFVGAGAAGRLDAQSGHGPWPEGLMRLGWFLKRLGTTEMKRA
jgi:predicted alpha/beta hydrolase family esterase